MSNLFVVGMGTGTVFVGLIFLVILTYIMGLICRPRTKKSKFKNEPEVIDKNNPEIENRQEIIAAVSAVIAEELGTDISAIKIHSFKKI
ncbi:MAG: OadG family protein [Clostridia bacterium]|nr:OadG family protein [Clostridia bacterium]